jgi:phenylacetate-CoA ligase
LSPHYLLELSRRGHLDDLTVRVEIKPEVASEADKQAAAHELQHHIKSYIGINTAIEIVAPGHIERSVGKARRVIDKRPQ